MWNTAKNVEGPTEIKIQIKKKKKQIILSTIKMLIIISTVEPRYNEVG